ncbi:MAG: FkbM family methyltransferase [Methanobacterium sp.]|nr:FkbM family methyltransferase [Methanobacterium sp.]
MFRNYDNARLEEALERPRHLVEQVDRRLSEGVAIYGAGFLGTWACGYLTSNHIPVTKFIDRDSSKAGKAINGVPIVSASREEIASAPAILIAARHAVRNVEEVISPIGVPAVSFDAYYVVKNLERYLQCRDAMLSDERSVSVFNALLVAMLESDLRPCKDVMEKDMYFSGADFSGNFEETFVDAGAFVGDTVERFIWENLGTFRHIYAFEPGYRQFKALRNRLGRLASEWAFDPGSVSLVRAGLSDVKGTMGCTFLDDFPLRHGLTAANVVQSAEESEDWAPVVRLDDYLDGSFVSFIKADVEGMELELLRGARQTIQTFRPKMALCAYHYPNHIFEIAEYVRSIVPDYKLSLRQHAPIFGDFVLYCSM